MGVLGTGTTRDGQRGAGRLSLATYRESTAVKTELSEVDVLVSVGFAHTHALDAMREKVLLHLFVAEDADSAEGLLGRWSCFTNLL